MNSSRCYSVVTVFLGTLLVLYSSSPLMSTANLGTTSLRLRAEIY